MNKLLKENLIEVGTKILRSKTGKYNEKFNLQPEKRLAFIETICQWFENDPNFGTISTNFDTNKNIFAYGPSRCGKSLLFETLSEISINLKTKPFYYVTMAEVEMDIYRYGATGLHQYTFGSYAKKTVEGSLDLVCAFDKSDPVCYCFDEVGEEKESINYMGTKISIKQDLIKVRLDLGLPTIFISNLTPKSVMDKYGEKIGFRLYETCNFIGY
jgi:energy-coupling factor transporter ATP-binding protein EcfA2